jgi:hypothetical protein
MKDLFTLVFFLILTSLVLRYWKGANELFKTGLGGGNTIIKTLES